MDTDQSLVEKQKGHAKKIAFDKWLKAWESNTGLQQTTFHGITKLKYKDGQTIQFDKPNFDTIYNAFPIYTGYNLILVHNNTWMAIDNIPEYLV